MLSVYIKKVQASGAIQNHCIQNDGLTKQSNYLDRQRAKELPKFQTNRIRLF